MMVRYTVSKALTAMTARAFLQKQIGVSLHLWRRIKHSGSFRQNGQLVNPALTTLQPGDEISYDLGETTTLQPRDLPLDIRYEDGALLIVNKPAGQLVYPTVDAAEPTLANAVLGYYQRTQQAFIFHPVHRLDRNTSGLVMIAKLPQIQYQLTRQENKRFQRSYVALVTGQPVPAAGQIDAPIARQPDSTIKRMVSPEGKPAITQYETLSQNEQYSLLFLRLKTGRTHQIRVHLAQIGCPLLGDDLYGGSRELIGRQALHACQLEFIHPVSGKEICLQCPPPKDMQLLIQNLPFFLPPYLS